MQEHQEEGWKWRTAKEEYARYEMQEQQEEGWECRTAKKEYARCRWRQRRCS